MSLTDSYLDANNISGLLKQLILLQNKYSKETCDYKQDKFSDFFEKKPCKFYRDLIFLCLKLIFPKVILAYLKRVNGVTIFVMKTYEEISLEIEKFSSIHEKFENLNISN
jgi:hypothetical protein